MYLLRMRKVIISSEGYVVSVNSLKSFVESMKFWLMELLVNRIDIHSLSVNLFCQLFYETFEFFCMCVM